MSSQTDISMQKLLTGAATRGVTDMHVSVGQPPAMRVDGVLHPLEEEGVVTPEVMEGLVTLLLDESSKQDFLLHKRATVSRMVGSRMRFKANVIYQQGYPSISFHFLSPTVRPLKELGLPKIIEDLTAVRQGLILVVGPYGSGRTTLIMSFIDAVNHARSEHIIVLEDPIEYVISGDKSLVDQQEVGRDIPTLTEGLRGLREEDVNVIAVSDLPDSQTFKALIDLAEGGRLCIAPLEAETVVQALERLVEPFAAHERERIMHSLADNLVAVIGLRLVPRVGGGRLSVTEVLMVTTPVKVLIREGRFAQISSWLLSTREGGTVGLDRSLAELVKTGEVLLEDALEYAVDKENFQRLVRS